MQHSRLVAQWHFTFFSQWTPATASGVVLQLTQSTIYTGPSSGSSSAGKASPAGSNGTCVAPIWLTTHPEQHTCMASCGQAYLKSSSIGQAHKKQQWHHSCPQLPQAPSLYQQQLLQQQHTGSYNGHLQQHYQQWQHPRAHLQMPRVVGAAGQPGISLALPHHLPQQQQESLPVQYSTLQVYPQHTWLQHATSKPQHHKQQHHHQQQQQWRLLHSKTEPGKASKAPLTNHLDKQGGHLPASRKPGAAPQETHAARSADSGSDRQPVPGSSFTTLPNMLSLSRVVLAPWLAYTIAVQQWPLALGITVAAGATDWLDGYLARRMGHTSKLGSYLDPLADKIFVSAAVGTMGYLGMVPAWLAVLVVGRDSGQVVGMFGYRLRMFGGRWPGAAAFFDVDHAVVRHHGPQQAQQHAGSSANNSSSSDSHLGAATGSAAAAATQSPRQQSGGELPQIRPLLISKANTALVLLLVAGSMTLQWQGLPPQHVLDALELITAGTTAASAAVYARLHWKGQLLSSGAQQDKGL